MGVLYEKRTMSDVSQALGIRQGELVTRLHRAQLAIGMALMNKRGH
jgi:DNA-directed RNA polymerase specialized sigma24 family protein